MEISITAVTANRRFSKALSRTSQATTCLEESCQNIPTAEAPFDILQIVFVDEPESYVKGIGTRRDRLYQIEIGVPEGLEFKLTEDAIFIAKIAQQFRRAVKLSGLAEPLIQEILTHTKECCESLSQRVKRG
jgi:hypothetical protein